MKQFVLFFLMASAFSSFGEKSLKPVFILGQQAENVSVYYSPQFRLDKNSRKQETKDQIVIRADKNSHIQVGVSSGKVHIALKQVSKINVRGMKNIQLFISTQQGDVQIDKSNGKFIVSLDKGSLNLKNSKGELTVHSYSAPVAISNLNGSAEVLSYSSSVSIKESKGQFRVQSYSGALSVDQLQGRLDFRVEKSPVRLKNFQGDMAGYSNHGAVKGSLTPKDVKVETGSGLIRLYFQSRARVNAQSWEGRVYAPRNFYIDKAGGVYKARGQIKDRASVGGKVFLKSQSGKIYIL